MLAHTLRALEACPEIAAVVIAAREEDRAAIAAVVQEARVQKVAGIVAGGSTRQESVHQGVLAAPADCPLVAVHDGARPLVRPDQISACIAAAERTGGALLALPITDTLKETGPSGARVRRTLDRRTIWAAQTPQIFRRDWLLEAHARGAADPYQATDDCELVERLGYPIEVVAGVVENLKITTAQDYQRAERILREREGMEGRQGMLRMGFGHDAHQLGPGRPLILGGIEVPHDQGLVGHSDADVLLHALVDALLGAIAGGDIGQLFPSSDPAYRNADSRIFLRRAAECVRERGMRIVNVDVTLVAQEPKISPYVPPMRAVIAKDLDLDLDRVSVKATTTDHLGYPGRKEGMAAYAVAVVSEV